MGIKGSKVWGIPRGGSIIAGLSAQVGTVLVDRPEDAEIIMDDIVDSGATRDRIMSEHGNKEFLALVDKPKEGILGTWIVFPWEGEGGDLEDNVRRIIQFIGDDPSRDGLLETPERVVRSWGEIFSGYGEEKEILKWFENENSDEMVIMRQIGFWSTCEHHMLPFWGTVDIGYLPNGKVIGISKLARLVDAKARRLQIQERLTMEIGQVIERGDVRGVGVSITARHACMICRGARQENAFLTTNFLSGIIKSDPAARAEFLMK